jgi:chaperonin cofactor prefoldin
MAARGASGGGGVNPAMDETVRREMAVYEEIGRGACGGRRTAAGGFWRRDAPAAMRAEIQLLIDGRSRSEAQWRENKAVKVELEALADGDGVWKLTGPVLAKQDRDDARRDVDARIAFLQTQMYVPRRRRGPASRLVRHPSPGGAPGEAARGGWEGEAGGTVGGGGTRVRSEALEKKIQEAMEKQEKQQEVVIKAQRAAIARGTA